MNFHDLIKQNEETHRTLTEGLRGAPQPLQRMVHAEEGVDLVVQENGDVIAVRADSKPDLDARLRKVEIVLCRIAHHLGVDGWSSA